jgi:hypothetical protein
LIAVTVQVLNSYVDQVDEHGQREMVSGLDGVLRSLHLRQSSGRLVKYIQDNFIVVNESEVRGAVAALFEKGVIREPSRDEKRDLGLFVDWFRRNEDVVVPAIPSGVVWKGRDEEGESSAAEPADAWTESDQEPINFDIGLDVSLDEIESMVSDAISDVC